jgi:hypothetical protein
LLGLVEAYDGEIVICWLPGDTRYPMPHEGERFALFSHAQIIAAPTHYEVKKHISLHLSGFDPVKNTAIGEH